MARLFRMAVTFAADDVRLREVEREGSRLFERNLTGSSFAV
jgi:hypothetical protein